MYINTLIQQLIADPRGVLLFFLLALPGRLLAISAHEAAHGWVADRCGDPTARLMGRVSLNPLKHFDLVGTICLLLFGFGWAKPVPVNPNNFRNYRGDDLKVSLAGITMNLLLFLTGGLVMYAAIWAAMGQVSYFAYSSRATAEVFRTVYSGVDALVSGQYWVSISDLLAYPSLAADMLIAPVFGEVWSYVYQMIYYLSLIHIYGADGAEALAAALFGRRAAQREQQLLLLHRHIGELLFHHPDEVGRPEAVDHRLYAGGFARPFLRFKRRIVAGHAQEQRRIAARRRAPRADARGVDVVLLRMRAQEADRGLDVGQKRRRGRGVAGAVRDAGHHEAAACEQAQLGKLPELIRLRPRAALDEHHQWEAVALGLPHRLENLHRQPLAVRLRERDVRLERHHAFERRIVRNRFVKSHGNLRLSALGAVFFYSIMETARTQAAARSRGRFRRFSGNGSGAEGCFPKKGRAAARTGLNGARRRAILMKECAGEEIA